jgi:hypothetical protein
MEGCFAVEEQQTSSRNFLNNHVILFFDFKLGLEHG